MSSRSSTYIPICLLLRELCSRPSHVARPSWPIWTKGPSPVVTRTIQKPMSHTHPKACCPFPEVQSSTPTNVMSGTKSSTRRYWSTRHSTCTVSSILYVIFHFTPSINQKTVLIISSAVPDPLGCTWFPVSLFLGYLPRWSRAHLVFSHLAVPSHKCRCRRSTLIARM